MSAKDVVRTWLTAIEENELNTVRNLLADEFVFEGFAPFPLDRAHFLRMMAGLREAIPNWDFNKGRMEEHGKRVEVQVRLAGTHRGELVIPLPGLGKVPPTGRSFVLPEERLTFVVENDKIVHIRSNEPPGGGLQGILDQLGIPFPSPRTRAVTYQ